MPQITVTEHLLLHQKESPMATGRFTRLLNELTGRRRSFPGEVRKAGLVDALGFTARSTSRASRLQKLDENANKVSSTASSGPGLSPSPRGERRPHLIPDSIPRGKTSSFRSPGRSSNIDANATWHHLSIDRAKDSANANASATCSRRFRAGGRRLFPLRTSNMILYTTGTGFTVHLEPSVGEFLLSPSGPSDSGDWQGDTATSGLLDDN